jgi:hypothetical protein
MEFINFSLMQNNIGREQARTKSDWKERFVGQRRIKADGIEMHQREKIPGCRRDSTVAVGE